LRERSTWEHHEYRQGNHQPTTSLVSPRPLLEKVEIEADTPQMFRK
jgi:hypothetical protein